MNVGMKVPSTNQKPHHEMGSPKGPLEDNVPFLPFFCILCLVLVKWGILVLDLVDFANNFVL
jgi:hypothetical protein